MALIHTHAVEPYDNQSEHKDTAANKLMQNEDISNISCLNISFNYANKLPVLRSVNLKFSLGKMYG
ncbi:MAG: hypothetical protein VXZ88_05985, partial [Verrucomicrobiota bacterium]|nr:hypothetical protein [Verrucomicrobiota bacterium]